MIKKLGIGGSYLNIIKIIHGKLTANIVLNDKRQKTFSCKIRKERSRSELPLKAGDKGQERHRATCSNSMERAIGFKGPTRGAAPS